MLTLAVSLLRVSRDIFLIGDGYLVFDFYLRIWFASFPFSLYRGSYLINVERIRKYWYSDQRSTLSFNFRLNDHLKREKIKIKILTF